MHSAQQENLRFYNDNGSLHVAELSIEGTIFHLHEITANPHFFSAEKYNGTTTLIGLFVSDVDEVMSSAIKAGAIETNPAKDYEYGYASENIKIPFGHHWMIQKKI